MNGFFSYVTLTKKTEAPSPKMKIIKNTKYYKQIKYHKTTKKTRNIIKTHKRNKNHKRKKQKQITNHHNKNITNSCTPSHYFIPWS